VGSVLQLLFQAPVLVIGLFLLVALGVLVVQFLPVRKVPLRYNWRNLVVRWRTTLLTAVGFTLVVGLLVVMLAFVEGLNALSKKTGPEGNVIILRDGANDELFSDLSLDEQLSAFWLDSEGFPQVLPAPKGPDGKRASREIYSIATQELPPKEPGGRPEYRFLQVRGVEDPEVAGEVHGLKLKPGGDWPDPSGTQAVMGEGIARTLGLGVGSEFSPRPGLNWTVAGILDSRGSPFDSEIWAKREDVGKYFGKDSETQRFYTSVVVTTADLATAQEYARTAQARNSKVRISAMPEQRYYEEMSKSNQMFLGAALFIAVVMAIGGMFGLMTTMFAAVSQRIKDIGVLRVMGYRRWQVLQSFLLESLLLALVGGGLGLALGFLFNGVEQRSLISSGQGGGKTVVFTMLVNTTVLLYAAGFILVMGVLGGLLPALTAMRLRVLDALR
jgi:ABC-type lipoprotein release transport system permease subunit